MCSAQIRALLPVCRLVAAAHGCAACAQHDPAVVACLRGALTSRPSALRSLSTCRFCVCNAADTPGEDILCVLYDVFDFIEVGWPEEQPECRLRPGMLLCAAHRAGLRGSGCLLPAAQAQLGCRLPHELLQRLPLSRLRGCCAAACPSRRKRRAARLAARAAPLPAACSSTALRASRAPPLLP